MNEGMGIKDFLKKIRQYRWVAWTISAVAAVLRLGWFVFSHYGWLFSVAAIVVAYAGHFYSPKMTDSALAALLAFAAVRVMTWQARQSWEAQHKSAPVSMPVAQPAPPPDNRQALLAAGPRKTTKLTLSDYLAWDLLDYFEVWQICALWADRDPVLNPSILPETYPISLAIKQAIASGKLPAEGLPDEVRLAFRPDPADVCLKARACLGSIWLNSRNPRTKNPTFFFLKTDFHFEHENCRFPAI